MRSGYGQPLWRNRPVLSISTHLIPLAGIKQDYASGTPETDPDPGMSQLRRSAAPARSAVATPEELSPTGPCRPDIIHSARFNVHHTDSHNPTLLLTGSVGQLLLLIPRCPASPPSYGSHRLANLSCPVPDTRTDKTQRWCCTRRSLTVRQADERPGKEPAVALQHIVIGQYRGIQLDRDLGERHAIEAVFIAVGLLARTLVRKPDVFDAVRHL